jgi:branched-chain amino acid transport system permease protein
VIERLVLRPLVNQEGVALLMATLGRHLLPRRLRPDALGQRHLQDRPRHRQGTGDDPRQRVPGRHPGQQGGFRRRRRGRRAGRGWRCFSRRRDRRALRAVADDHQAAQSIGIPLNRIWVIVWSVAGFVALVAGVIWGSQLGVQFSLSQVALKALPVVILGGFTSVPGAIVGGLIIGVGEKMAEVFLGPCWSSCSTSRRRHRELVRLRARAAVPAGAARGPVRRKNIDRV